MIKHSVSIILPIHQESSYISKVISAVGQQTYQNFELIIVDSSMNGLNQLRQIDFPSEKIKIVNSKQSYPGAARNEGIKAASYDYLAFIDLKTIPKNNWLEDALSQIYNMHCEVLLGRCISKTENFHQKIIKCLTYGSKPFTSLPGTIITREALTKSGIFIKSIRAGEDIEWISRLYSLDINVKTNSSVPLLYFGFPKYFIQSIKKWYIYSIENSKVNILTFQKVIYFYIFLVGFLYWVYSWNFIFTYGEWDDSTAFIPNLNSTVWTLVFIAYFLARSIFIPLTKREKLFFILPLNWLILGIYGILLDCVKVPGRILGLIRIISSNR